MRKLLFLSFVLAISVGAYSQQLETKAFAKKARVTEPEKVTVEHNMSQPEIVIPLVKSGKDGTVEKVEINESANVYGSLNTHSRQIHYHPELGVLSFIFRANPSIHPEALASGTIMASYSSDYGATWSEPCYVVNTVDGPGQYNNRYPNGTIYNPPGNTSLDNAYFLVAGPAHDGEATVTYPWIFFGSSTLGCDNNYSEFYVTEPTNDMGGYFSGLSIIARDEVALASHLTCVEIEPGFFASTDIEFSNMVGTWNEDHFEFAEGEEVSFTDILSKKSDDNELTWRGAYTGGDYGMGFNWSRDLMTGYMWLIGQSEDILMGCQPVVFKTTDGGMEWNEIEIDFEDFDDIFDLWVFETWDGVVAPRFNQTKGVVDAEGNLQLFAQVISSSTIHSDSVASWGYLNELGNLFNIEISDDGVEEVIWIDSLFSQIVEDDDECAYASTTGWNHRLGISKSPDESVLFFTWTDDRSGNELNCSPDIYGNFRRIEEDVPAEPETVSFTSGTAHESVNYYTFASEYAWYDYDEKYWNIPVTQSVNEVQYLLNINTDAITHRYVEGIRFYDDQVTGVNKQTASPALSVKPNVPNPATGITTFEFDLTHSEIVHMHCTNMLGQTIYERPAGTFNSGSNLIQVDVSGWESGVYFYTLQAGSDKVTGKMVVK